MTRPSVWAPRWLPAAPAQRALLRTIARHDGDICSAADALRLDRTTVYRVLRRDRLRSDAADRIAVALGRHPFELWPEWLTDNSPGGTP